MDIRLLAIDMVDAVGLFMEKAKGFFYAVMLFGHRCPKCNGSLIMARDGKCLCVSCGNEADPTIAFQRCSECGGIPVLRVRRYRCQNCGKDIQSKFLFNGLAFDTDYFRLKMVESRKRKQVCREKVRQMLAESRSTTISLPPAELEAFPDLIEALNQLTADSQASMKVESQAQFDLHRYETHIQANVQDFPRCLTDIPPLTKDLRKDIIWRFITIIFLAHSGQIDIWQEGPDVMVTKHETNRKRQNLPGNLDAIDEVQGSLGRAETW